MKYCTIYSPSYPQIYWTNKCFVLQMKFLNTFPVLDFNRVRPPIPWNVDENEIKKVFDRLMKSLESIQRVLFSRPENSIIKAIWISGPLCFSCLDYCICRVVEHRVEELLINLWMTCGDRFDLPKCVLECDSSRTLTLSKASYIPIQPAEDTKSRFCFSSSLVKATGLRLLHTSSLTYVDIWETWIVIGLWIYFQIRHSLSSKIWLSILAKEWRILKLVVLNSKMYKLLLRFT